jgi:glycosyltransferase involved in cell wall biosynthesis
VKTIGVFLGYAPEQPLRNQGIGRLLAALLKQWSARESPSVVVACPLWYRDAIGDLLREHSIPPQRVELLTTSSIPAVLTLKARWDAWRSRRRRPRRRLPFLRARARALLRRVAIAIFAAPTLGSFTLRVLLASPLFVLSAPFALAGWAALYTAQSAKWLVASAQRRFGPLRRSIAFLNAPRSTLKQSRFANFVYEAARGGEFARLVELINARDDIDVWYVPTLFWPETRGIRAPTVLAAPDVVHVDFPTRFNDVNERTALRRLTESATRATHLVCYSEHVRERHLVDALGIDRSRCSVIHHGYDGMTQLLDIDPATASPQELRHYCAGVLRDYQAQHLYGHDYLANFDFASARFFVYSSQVRPHKNHLLLLQAFEHNLRQRYVNAKLVLTGDLSAEPDAAQFYRSRRLSYDVIMLRDVPNEVLTALNCLAVCSVNPSLFEGGFPFTFAEAYAVGTPSIMAAMPVTLEQVRDPALRRLMLFDPRSVTDMADRMAFACQHPDELRIAQAPFYRELARRTWSVAADDYLALFRSVARERPAH